MNKLLNYFIFILLLFFPLLGKAQQLTLDNCFELGNKNHPDFKIQYLKIEHKKASKRSVGSHFLPEVGISASHAYNFGSSINPSSNSREPSNIQSDNFSIDFRANLIDFSQWKETTIQNLDIEIEKWNLVVIENQFQLLVLEKYMKALSLQQWKKTMRFQIETSLETLNKIKKEVEEGKRALSDDYDINVIYLQEINELEKTSHDEVLAKLELIQLLNVSEFKPSEIELLFPNDALNANESYQVNQHPSLQKNSISIKKNEAEFKQLWNNYLPTLGFNYSYGSFFAQKISNFSDTSFNFQNQLKDNKSQYVGLALYIPIFNKGRVAQKRAMKKIEHDVLVEEDAKEQKRLHDLMQTLETKQALLKNTEKRLTDLDLASQKAFETTSSKYLFDKVDVTAYKVAKNQLLQTQYNVLSNRMDQLFVSQQLKLNFMN